MNASQQEDYGQLGQPSGNDLQDAITAYNAAQTALAAAQTASASAGAVLETKIAAFAAKHAEFKGDFALPAGYSWPA